MCDDDDYQDDANDADDDDANDSDDYDADDADDGVLNLLQASIKPLPLSGRIVRVRGVTASCSQVPIQVPCCDHHHDDHDNLDDHDDHEYDDHDDHEHGDHDYIC